MFDKYLDPFIFLIAFAVGMLAVYTIQPQPTIIYKFPTPENAGQYTYQDENKNCYKYEAKEVKCPSDPSLILEHPIIIK